MMIFFQVFTKAQESEFIEDEGDAFGSQRGIAIGHLKMHVCASRIA